MKGFDNDGIVPSGIDQGTVCVTSRGGSRHVAWWCNGAECRLGRVHLAGL